MRIDRRIWIKLAILAVIAIVAFSIMGIGYVRLPNLMFGAGHYQVTVKLPEAAGLYRRANVTYLGTEVGQVTSIGLSNDGVAAELSLRSDVKIPSNLDVEVHSTSAVGEQYIALAPRDGNAAPLKGGDVIPADRVLVPPDISSLLDATNTGLLAIPGDDLKTVIDESSTAVGGLGPEISRLVKGSTTLAIDSRANLGALTNLVDNVGPILQSQIETSSAIRTYAANLADITSQIKDSDARLRRILTDGPGAAGEARQLFDRLRPTLPILMANLASIAPVLVTYRPNLEQILVLLPQTTANVEATTVATRNAPPGTYTGSSNAFNLNFNVPPPCLTGFLPAQQRRTPVDVDAPDRPQGNIYCRTPQDSQFNVRGARNIPCETRPGKRAPTVKMCESDEEYVPLNDGFNWKGDPNATLSGQDIPQLSPAAPAAPLPPAAAPPPIAVAEYDPATGMYTGPDGQLHRQGDLAQSAPGGKTWQSMLLPPQ